MHLTKDLICEEVNLEEKSDKAIERLAEQLYQVADRYYVIDNFQTFTGKIFFPELTGNLVIYYANNAILGFTRMARRILEIDGIEYAIYFGGTYQAPDRQLYTHSARICLMQALRYKLFQPNHQLVYLANANNPQRYAYIREISDEVEPREDGSSSELVKRLMKQLCEMNQWQFDQKNPQLVRGLLPLKPIWLTQHFHQSNDFLQLNPGYMDGDSLFMYLPLDMQTLGRCIHRSVSDVHIVGGMIE